ncbi:MAG: hypothetical protein ACR652_05600 [Methylocystis sp.]|uniref:hypothetical protein n=1 Tax=Methylocystis sp. TaxID=1911079 RepID=UPI003DA67E79
MLHKLAFATIAAINFAVPTIAYTIEEDSQQPGERSHENGANQDWNHLMQENEGYGLGDLVEPGMNYGEVMQVRKVMGTARRFALRPILAWSLRGRQNSLEEKNTSG